LVKSGVLTNKIYRARFVFNDSFRLSEAGNRFASLSVASNWNLDSERDCANFILHFERYFEKQ